MVYFINVAKFTVFRTIIFFGLVREFCQEYDDCSKIVQSCHFLSVLPYCIVSCHFTFYEETFGAAIHNFLSSHFSYFQLIICKKLNNNLTTQTIWDV